MSKELYKHKKPYLCAECSLCQSTIREMKEKRRSSDIGKEVQSKEFMRQCSCSENSPSISSSPGQVFLTENPFPVSRPVIGNLTYAGAWDVLITPKAFLLTPVKCMGCKEASTSELWLCCCRERRYNCSLDFPWAWLGCFPGWLLAQC